MAKKYLKNESGVVRAVTSDNLQLEKPLLNENYDIEVHNRNMDKIDSAIQEVKGKIDGLELVASNVKMANGTTVEDTINELFQSANNGKELIANAIGEPISKEDTFNTMSTDINSLLSEFKANMMNNGVTVESGDKFKVLIDKIATLANSGAKGVRFAEGTVNKSFNSSTTYGKTYSFKVSTNLDFVPNIILVQTGNIISNPSSSVGAKGIWQNSLVSNLNTSTLNYYGDYQALIPVLKINIKDITKDSFIIDVPTCSAYISCNFTKYYAIGVGEEDNTLRDSLASILQGAGVDTTGDDMATLITKVETLINSKARV